MAQSDPWDEEAANIQKSGHPLAATATVPDQDDYSIWNKTRQDASPSSPSGGWRDNIISGINAPDMTPDAPDTLKGRFERFGQRTASGLANTVLHPIDTAVSAIKPTQASTPQEMQQSLQGDVDTIKDYAAHPENLAGDVASAAIAGRLVHGANKVAGAVGSKIGSAPQGVVPGENYTPEHHKALSAVLARGTGMGKDFIAPDVATDIGSRVRQAAANSPQKAEVIQSGTPKDALAATQSVLEDAQHQIDYEHNQARGPVTNNPVDMKPVQDAIPTPKKFHGNAEGKALQTLRDRAGRVENLEDLNDFRQYLNQQTAPEYRKNAIAAGRSSVEDAALMDAATAARNHYYDSLQDATGLDFRGAKRAEGSLMKAQEALGNAAPGLVNKDTLANADKGKLETAADVAEGGSRFAHGGLPVVGYLAQKLRGTDLSQLQRQLKIGFSDLPNAQQYRGPLTSQVGRAPLKLPASVPANAPYGAPSQAAGSTGPAVPSTITPVPNQPLQLPAQSGPEGQGIPPAPQWDAPPPLNQASRFQRTNPPLPPNPTVTPAGRNIVTPNGEVIPDRPQLKAPEKPKKKNKEEDTFDGKTSAGAQVPSEVTALLHRTGAKITNNEAPTSQSVASVSPDDPNTINIDDKERFDKDKNAANQTLSHEAVHIWHNNLPPEIQKMIPMDDPKDPYHGDGYEPDELKQMRSLGVKLWNLPRERAATIIQKYAHMGGDNAPKEIKEAYGPWAKDLVDSPLSTVQETSADQQGINTAVRPPAPMQEMKIFGEGEGKPEKEDTPNGKREVLHGSKDREDLVEEAKAEAPHLEKGLKAVADQNKGAKFDAVRGEKSEGRLTEKIKREGQPVETVPDVLAGRIAVDSDEAKDAVVSDLKKHTTVVREKDEFKSGDSRFGFHAHKLQVKVSPKLSAEVQVVPKETAAQDDKQHPIYKQARTAELDGDTGKAKELASKAKEMNDGAKSRFDLRNKEKENADLPASRKRDSGDSGKRSGGGTDAGDKPERTPRGDGDGRGSSDNGGDGVRGDKSHRVGDKVTLPSGKSATVAYAPSKSSQLPTYRFKDEDGKTVEMRARDAESKVKKAEPVDDDKPKGWVGVDLDGSLATYDGWKGADHIGEPIPMMVSRVKKMLANGQDVRIFTARIDDDKSGSAKKAIESWARKHVGQTLPITNIKDRHMTALYDDRAIQVKRNQGHIMGSRKQATAESA